MIVEFDSYEDAMRNSNDQVTSKYAQQMGEPQVPRPRRARGDGDRSPASTPERFGTRTGPQDEQIA
jgi:hypothetical protein